MASSSNSKQATYSAVGSMLLIVGCVNDTSWIRLSLIGLSLLFFGLSLRQSLGSGRWPSGRK